MYRLNEKKMFCDISGEFTVIINAETGIYYGINNFGTSVFQWIVSGSPVPEILAVLNQINGVPADMQQRLSVFVLYLIEKEIIIGGGEAKNEIKINEEFAQKSGFQLKIGEFLDAQELLLSDPIHDVEPEVGWQPFLQNNQ
jgi:hypothetical protein